MIHPYCETNAPNHLGNFNTVTDEGRRWLAAMLEFCAERWSRPDQKHGRVSGYILGNEVNSHWWWANNRLPAWRLAPSRSVGCGTGAVAEWVFANPAALG